MSFCLNIILPNCHFRLLRIAYSGQQGTHEEKNDSHAFAETLRVTPATTFAYFLHKNEAYNAQTGKKHVSPKEDSALIVPS